MVKGLVCSARCLLFRVIASGLLSFELEHVEFDSGPYRKSSEPNLQTRGLTPNGVSRGSFLPMRPSRISAQARSRSTRGLATTGDTAAVGEVGAVSLFSCSRFRHCTTRRSVVSSQPKVNMQVYSVTRAEFSRKTPCGLMVEMFAMPARNRTPLIACGGNSNLG